MHEELMEKENPAFFSFNVGTFILPMKENSFFNHQLLMWKLHDPEILQSLSPSSSLFPSFFSPLFFYLLVQHSLTFSIVGIKDFSNTNLNTKHISCKRWVVWIQGSIAPT